MEKKKIKKHESFGMIRAGRVTSGRGSYMFESNVKHSTYIELTITRAEQVEDYGSTSVFPREELIRVSMSPVQWASLLTNMNSMGTPCTIERVLGKSQEPFELEEDKPATAFRIGKEYLENAATKGLLTNIRKYIEELKITKKHKEALEAMTRSLDTNLKSNAEFYLNQFIKAAEETVQESIAEAEASRAFIMEKLGEIKLDELKKLKDGQD